MKPSPALMEILSTIAVVAATVKFLSDGVSFNGVSLGHVDATAYAMFLAPVLGAHGYIKTKSDKNKEEKENNQ